MTDLVASTAFGGTAARVDRLGPVTLTERMDLGLASLALRSGDRPTPFGMTLAEPGACVAGEATGCFWMAPGQWMIEGQGKAATDFAAEVLAQAPGCSVTEQTDGWVIVDIDGPAEALERMRERLVNLPAAALAPGKATRTLMHHMTVFILRRSEGTLTVMGMRSYAGSIWHALAVTAARLG